MNVERLVLKAGGGELSNYLILIWEKRYVIYQLKYSLSVLFGAPKSSNLAHMP